MTSKGKQYSTIVRRAGLAWGKGDLQKAITALHEGITLATENGDMEVVRVLQQDLERYQRAAAGKAVDLSR
jgi:predicted nucleic acid-binding protein